MTQPEPAFDDDYDDDECNIYKDEHGGGCCGASHLSNFTEVRDFTLSQLDEKLQYRPNVRQGRDLDPSPLENYGHLYEIVLTDRQMNSWAKPLKERGFKFCARWLNTNSNNYCNLLVFIVGKEPTSNPSYEW